MNDLIGDDFFLSEKWKCLYSFIISKKNNLEQWVLINMIFTKFSDIKIFLNNLPKLELPLN